jgi:hypothetical protein
MACLAALFTNPKLAPKLTLADTTEQEKILVKAARLLIQLFDKLVTFHDFDSAPFQEIFKEFKIQYDAVHAILDAPVNTYPNNWAFSMLQNCSGWMYYKVSTICSSGENNELALYLLENLKMDINKRFSIHEFSKASQYVFRPLENKSTTFILHLIDNMCYNDFFLDKLKKQKLYDTHKKMIDYFLEKGGDINVYYDNGVHLMEVVANVDAMGLDSSSMVSNGSLLDTFRKYGTKTSKKRPSETSETSENVDETYKKICCSEESFCV